MASTRQTDRILAIDGGSPLRVTPWPTYDKGATFLGSAEEAAAVRAIRSGRLFRYDNRPHEDTEVGRFESRVCQYFTCRHALAVSSGTAAIALGLMAAGIGPGKRVACPVFTFAATPSAIVLAGAEPVLVPVDSNLYVDLEVLERILPTVDAAVVVHMRGFAENLAAITALADAAGVPLIEDAVPALGVRIAARPVGTYGLVGCFSTQSDKSINTGEGGFLITEDADLLARATVLSGAYEGRVRRHVGAVGLDELSLPIYSMRMDEIRGALAAVQLESLPDRVYRLARNYARIGALLTGLPGVRVRPDLDGAVLGDALLLLLDHGDGKDAAWFARALRAEGIDARALGDPADRNVRAFWNWRFLDQSAPDRAHTALAHSTQAVARTVDIPLSAAMTEEDCLELVTAIELISRRWRSAGGVG